MMKILVAIDGSESSGAAVRTISQRPWPAGSIARVIAIARPVIPPGELPLPGPMYDQMTRERNAEAEKVAARAADSLQGAGLVVEHTVREGDPRAEIVLEAERWGADLIVLGSHGRTGMKRWLMGSVAEHVVRHAHCSVEVARPKAAKPGAIPGVL